MSIQKEYLFVRQKSQPRERAIESHPKKIEREKSGATLRHRSVGRHDKGKPLD